MKRERIQQILSDENPEALLADDFEDAFIGVARRCGQPTLAVYDYELCVKVLMVRDHMTESDAVEFLEFNSVGAWGGEHTPIWFVRAE